MLAQSPGTTLSQLMAKAKVAIAGVLMGLAGLVPGVSGGTMILAVGLYTEFIDSVADLTAMRFSTRRIVFLGILGAFALATIKGLAGVVLSLLFQFDVAMYSLFMGMTLGGAPLLLRSLRRADLAAVLAAAAGFLLMILIVVGRGPAGIPHNTAVDVVAGLVAAITMVLPGVSGSYMLLIMGQYDRVVGAVERLDFGIILPVAIGAVAGIVLLSNVLKFLLHRFERATIGFLLGILIGSIVGLWPFGRAPSEEVLADRNLDELRQFAETKGFTDFDASDRDAMVELMHEHWDQRTVSDYNPAAVTTAAMMAAVGFFITFALSRQSEPLKPSPPSEPRP